MQAGNPGSGLALLQIRADIATVHPGLWSGHFDVGSQAFPKMRRCKT
jgi:hypothetical protein